MIKKRNKNQTVARCVHCQSERIASYWDDELECYIYLCDEPVVCVNCATNNVGVGVSRHETCLEAI